jgi:hypothetical protein
MLYARGPEAKTPIIDPDIGDFMIGGEMIVCDQKYIVDVEVTTGRKRRQKGWNSAPTWPGQRVGCRIFRWSSTSRHDISAAQVV